MTDRSVSVELRLKAASYLNGIRAAKSATRDLAQETVKATKQNHRNLEQVGRAGLIAGGAIAAGLGFAVKASMEFDKSLSGVKAVANATAAEMDSLRQAALDAGAATVFSASEAAEAEAELAKAGVSVKDILGGGLRGSLDLAAAGQLELADAATIAAQAMNIFKLRGSDVTHIADVLASGANKSAADVKQLGDALRQGGLVAAQTGVGLEETVGTLSAFADNALVGSDAGTSFKTMLQRLVPQSKEAGDAMESIGFNAFDAQGNFVGLEKVAGDLQAGLGKLSAEQRAATMNSIFGADAVRAANVLYEEGAAGIADYTAAMNDQGAAAEMAATQLDNLSGDLEALKGSIETALIQTGSGGNDALRGMTQAATNAVNAFSGLPKPVQTTAFAVGVISSASLLAAGAFGTLVPKVREGREALRSLGQAGVVADRGLGRAARAATKAGLAIAALAVAGEAFNGADSGFQRWAADIEAEAGPALQGQIRALTAEMDRLREISNEGLNTDLGFTNIHWTDWTGGAAAAGDKADYLEGRIAELRTALKGQKADAENSITAQDDLADAYQNTVSPAAEDAADAVNAYVEALQDTTEIDAYTATAELAESFKDLHKELKDGGKVTNDEKIALGGFAREVLAASEAIFDQTGNQGKANKALRDGREQFVQAAEAAGYGAKEARRLARQLLRIPARTDVDINTEDIKTALVDVQRLARRLHRLGGADVSVTVGAYNRANAIGYASGGMIPGPPSRSDTVPAWLSTGEFVVNAAATSANRSLLEAINSGQRFADGGIVRGTSISNITTSGPTLTMTNHIQAPSPTEAAQSVSRQVRNDMWQAGWQPA